MRNQKIVIANQVFLGFPWSTTKKKYMECCEKLRLESPISFIIVGVNDNQEVEDLFNRIKRKLLSSSFAIFDATGNNANVALEYGMAEALNIDRALYYNPTKQNKQPQRVKRIMADLAGLTRNEYRLNKELLNLLRTMSMRHPFTRRFEKFFKVSGSANMRKKKTREKRIALKIIHLLDDKSHLIRVDLIAACLNQHYEKNEVEKIVNRLVTNKLLVSGKTGKSKVSIVKA